MVDTTFNTSLASVAPSVATPTTASYFEILNQIIIHAQITTADGTRLSFAEGMDRAVASVTQLNELSNKVILIGNGGSAAIAAHGALDFWNAGGVPACTFNDSAQLTCLSNDFGFEHVFAKSIGMFAQTGDILIAISSSGKSPNILNGVSLARSKGCSVITLAGFAADNPLRSLGDLNIYVDSNSYGHVEVAHFTLIHYLTDMVKLAKRGAGK